MADARELAETPPELQGGYVADMEAALERAAQGIEATARDRECYRITAECIDSLYDDLIVPEGVPADFDRTMAYEALQAASDDPRSLAEYVSATLTVMSEGYTAPEADLEEVRELVAQYRRLHDRTR